MNKKTMFAVSVAALLVGSIGLLYFFTGGSIFGSGGQQWAYYSYEIIQKVRSGMYQEALAQYHSVLGSPESTRTSIARSARNVAPVEYRATGDIGAFLESIRVLKETIKDTAVNRAIKADNINELVNDYYISGQDPAVYAEIFKGAPFEEHLVEGNKRASLENLYQWSLETATSSRAAIGIAYLKARDLLEKPRPLTDAHVKTLGEVEEYLKIAEDAVASDALL